MDKGLEGPWVQSSTYISDIRDITRESKVESRKSRVESRKSKGVATKGVRLASCMLDWSMNRKREREREGGKEHVGSGSGSLFVLARWIVGWVSE